MCKGYAPLALLVCVRWWQVIFVSISRWKAHSRQGEWQLLYAATNPVHSRGLYLVVDFVPYGRWRGGRSVDTTKVKYP